MAWAGRPFLRVGIPRTEAAASVRGADGEAKFGKGEFEARSQAIFVGDYCPVVVLTNRLRYSGRWLGRFSSHAAPMTPPSQQAGHPPTGTGASRIRANPRQG